MTVQKLPLEYPSTHHHPIAPSLRPRLGEIALRAARHGGILAVFFLAWELAPRLGFVEAAFLPPISRVLETGWKLLLNGQLPRHFASSLGRSVAGFVLAILVAIPLGLAIGRYRLFAQVVNPLLEMFRNTAALALLPVFILFLGIGEVSKVAIVFYGCFWPILLNTITAVITVDPLLIKSARTMGLSPVRLFYKVILPASVPTIFVGIRLAGAVSVLILIAAEMIGAKSGLGYLILASQYNFQVPEMFLGIISITVVGLLINVLLVTLERRLTAWKRNGT
ncbi:MAG: ABC transporter permease [Zoogloeaceae bacterium]|jgi:NitT/TauT family transport system permease protein|nr:ABC transporter permease [Zoogloeaceae bacterium]